MKKLYLLLPALLVLCGCSEKIFPIRGVKKTATEQVATVDQPMQLVPIDMEATVEETPLPDTTATEEVTVERTPIPE